MTWKTFWTTTVATAIGVAAFLYAAIVLIDPYDSIAFSLPLDRVPIVTNQRFAYPAVARNRDFDSLLIGTSTTRMIGPAKLNEALGGHFANLSLNSGTANEQSLLFDVFVRHHPQSRTVVLGIDVVWCGTGDTYEKFTSRPFPPWLYDEDRWNDLLNVFNLPTVEQVGRLAGYFLGVREARYDKNGYNYFLPPRSAYDAARVRQEIYGDAGPRRHAPVVPVERVSAGERAAWQFPTHPLLVDMLAKLPAETRKIAVFVPYHHFNQPAEGSRAAAVWQECKKRVTRIVQGVENGHVLDFMIPSEITLSDENYWDVLHYGIETADRVAGLIGIGVRTRCGIAGLMDYLTLPTDPGGDIQVCARQEPG